MYRPYPGPSLRSQAKEAQMIKRKVEVFTSGCPVCEPSVEIRMDVVVEFARMLRSYGPASFFYSDGDLLFAHADRRIQPITREVSAPALYFLECPSVALEKNQSVILMASLPLSDAGWKPMPEGQVISVRYGEVVSSAQL